MAPRRYTATPTHRFGRGWAALSALVLLFLATTASAAPQWHGSLQPGIAGVGTRDALWQRTVFHGSLHGDVLFARESSNDLGVGPYFNVTTEAFSDLRLSLGPTVLSPLGSIATQWSVGAYSVVTTPHAWGAHGQLFIGSKSYNHYGAYSSGLGLVLGVDYGLGTRHECVMSAAVALDLAYLAIPFLLLYGSLQPSE
jgi:hypothetical protein